MSLIRRGEGDITDRYRPRRFSEIVGNDSNVKALLEILKDASRSKSFLFYGQPGSGKTTTARIMSMALNCENGDVDPCLECYNCRLALNKNALHINELNLAHLNTKEDAENIINQMYFTCLTGRNKIYIFDEAQMLTNQAQNLLLKNLEEPPPNTYIFICTTDPQKIIKTLRDRCQKFEFKYPSKNDLISVLKSVVLQEKWVMSDEDKSKFFDYACGLSIREVLKAFDQAIKGGIGTLVNITQDKVEYIEICRMLLASNFKGICEKLKVLEDNKELDCEALRCVIMGYFKSVLISKGLTPDGVQVCESMKIFQNPYFEARPIPKLYKDMFEACIYLGQVKGK